MDPSFPLSPSTLLLSLSVFLSLCHANLSLLAFFLLGQLSPTKMSFRLLVALSSYLHNL